MDILPDEIQRWQVIESKARSLLEVYGYKEIRTPIFEETELFVRSMGQTSDVVQKQMLTLQPQNQDLTEDIKKGHYSLRPEGTAAVVRSYIQNNLAKKENLSKLFYIGPMFRGERPQMGRLRQFHQIGGEAIGPNSSSPYLDAEIIALSVNILEELGLRNFQLKINTLGTLNNKRNFYNYLIETIKPLKKDLCPDCQDRYDRNVFRILECKNLVCQKICQTVGLGFDWLTDDSRKYFGEVKEALNTLNIKFIEAAYLVRGLDYYTHTVFEIFDTSLGSQDALGAGGRYNHLVSELGGPQVDAVGFALGIERILLALPQQQLKEEGPLIAYLIALDETSLKEAFQILNTLRQAGIACDLNYQCSNSLKSQMRLANKLNARYAIILGEYERHKGVVMLKDMREGSQQEVKVTLPDISKLTNILKS